MIRGLFILLLIGLAVLALAFESEMESWFMDVVGAGDAPPSFEEASGGARSWRLGQTVTIVLLASTGLIGLACSILSLYFPTYDYKLAHFAHPKEGARDAFFAATSAALVWVIWLVVACLYLSLGILLAAFVLFCLLSIAGGTALSWRARTGVAG